MASIQASSGLKLVSGSEVTLPELGGTDVAPKIAAGGKLNCDAAREIESNPAVKVMKNGTDLSAPMLRKESEHYKTTADMGRRLGANPIVPWTSSEVVECSDRLAKALNNRADKLEGK